MNFKNNISSDVIISFGRKALTNEAQSILEIQSCINRSFFNVIKCILNCKGRVILSGLGKTGHIAKKISATFSSSGTPSFFLHASEAMHGDLGSIISNDILIALSYSGEGNELFLISSIAKKMKLKVISITGKENSKLSKISDLNLNINTKYEACPLNLAPTSSTTNALALGDAIAVACIYARNFKNIDFAKSHPGGYLGRKLSIYINEIMNNTYKLPIVSNHLNIMNVLKIISFYSMGVTLITDIQSKIIGIFTDGDLRRIIENKGDIRFCILKNYMIKNPYIICHNILAYEVSIRMKYLKINQIIINLKGKNLIGLINMRDIIQAKLI